MELLFVIIIIVAVSVWFYIGHNYIRTVKKHLFEKIRTLINNKQISTTNNKNLYEQFEKYEKRINILEIASLSVIVNWTFTMLTFLVIKDATISSTTAFINTLIYSTWGVIIFNLPQLFKHYREAVFPNIYNNISQQSNKTHQ